MSTYNPNWRGTGALTEPKLGLVPSAALSGSVGDVLRDLAYVLVGLWPRCSRCSEPLAQTKLGAAWCVNESCEESRLQRAPGGPLSPEDLHRREAVRRLLGALKGVV